MLIPWEETTDLGDSGADKIEEKFVSWDNIVCNINVSSNVSNTMTDL